MCVDHGHSKAQNSLGFCYDSKLGGLKHNIKLAVQLYEKSSQQGYSGDIQTVDGYKILKGNPRFDTKAWWKWVQEKEDLLNKREAYCVEITGAVATRIKQRRGYKGMKGYRVFFFFGIGAC